MSGRRDPKVCIVKVKNGKWKINLMCITFRKAQYQLVVSRDSKNSGKVHSGDDG